MLMLSTLQLEYWEGSTHKHRRAPDHPVVAAFARPKLQLAAQYGVFERGTTVLDVGCGNGFFTYHLPPDVQAVGLDFSEQMLHLNSSSRLVQGTALRLPFADAMFDTVFCSNLLHHLPDPQMAVLEMRRVARRYVILSEPNRNNPGMFLLGLINRAERWSLKFTRRYVLRLGEQAGLDVIFCRSLGMVFPNKVTPAMLPFLRLVDGVHPLGAYILLIAQKMPQCGELK